MKDCAPGGRIRCIRSVPTSEQREGNFAGGPQIFDPLTLNPSTNTAAALSRQCHSQDALRPDRELEPEVLSCAEHAAVGGFNYVVSASGRNDGDQFHTRIDHQIGEKDSLFGRYSYSTGQKSISPPVYP